MLLWHAKQFSNTGDIRDESEDQAESRSMASIGQVTSARTQGAKLLSKLQQAL